MITTSYLRTKDKPTEEPKTPIIMIDMEALGEMLTCIREKTIEIMLLGNVVMKENETNIIYTITKIYIPPQTDNTSSFVTTHDEKYHEWLYELSREERIGMKMHLHTHPKMATNPSGVDEKMIRDRVENIDDFYIRIIANQSLSFRVDLFQLDKRLLHEEMNMYCATPFFFITLTKAGVAIQEHENKELTDLLEERIIPKHTYTYGRGSKNNSLDYQTGKVYDHVTKKYYWEYELKKLKKEREERAEAIKNGTKTMDEIKDNDEKAKQLAFLPPDITRKFSSIMHSLIDLVYEEERLYKLDVSDDDYIIARYELDETINLQSQTEIILEAFRAEIEVIAIEEPDTRVEDIRSFYIAEFDNICDLLDIEVTEADEDNFVGGFYNDKFIEAV